MADESTRVGLIRSKDHDYPSYYELSYLIVIQDFKEEVILTMNGFLYLLCMGEQLPYS